MTCHLRLVAKIAMGYRGYGLPLAEVISEGNVGLMQAVKRFDPERGFRLATYAMWWIRASIQEYILRSWSLVKLGTTSAQKKLFFNLRKVKAASARWKRATCIPRRWPRSPRPWRHRGRGDLDEPAAVGRRCLAERHGRLRRRRHPQWQDWLEDEDADQAAAYEAQDELEIRRELLAAAMDVLNDREKDILMQRRLQDNPVTLEELSGQYDVSRERIRQIEVRAFEKLQKRMKELARDKGIPVRA